MILTGAKYFDRDFHLVSGDIRLENGRIREVGAALSRGAGEEVLDCTGLLIAPGFVDVHIHGCAGADTCDGTREALDTMARFLLSHGVTSFCPTTMTIGVETIQRALADSNTAD